MMENWYKKQGKKKFPLKVRLVLNVMIFKYNAHVI